MGRTEHGLDLVFDLGAATHTVIQGSTRSGKSVFTYLLLSGLAQSPHVVVCGVDPTGILLHGFVDSPHPEWRHLGTSDMQGAADVLARLVDEMEQRIKRLRTHDLDKVDDFSSDLPILVIAMDEYPGTLAAAASDDEAKGRKTGTKVEPMIKRDVRRIIQEGAKVALRMVLLAQRADASIIGGTERSNLGQRVTLRVDNLDAVNMLHPNITPDLAALVPRFKPGVGLVERPGEPLVRFRSDFIDYATYLAIARSATPPINSDEGTES